MDLSEFEGIPYLAGKEDCYETVRRWFRIKYDMHLKNYARPDDFAYSGLDLIQQLFAEEGFKVKDISLNLLKPGDVLAMRVGNSCPTVNHLGVWTGEGLLHHLVDTPSKHEPLTTRWKHRTMSVLRHPEVDEMEQGERTVVEFETLLPAHTRHRLHERFVELTLTESTEGLLGADAGKVRPDTEDGGDS